MISDSGIKLTFAKKTMFETLWLFEYNNPDYWHFLKHIEKYSFNSIVDK